MTATLWDKPTPLAATTIERYCVVGIQATGHAAVLGYHWNEQSEADSQLEYYRRLYQGVTIRACRMTVDLTTPQLPIEVKR